MSLTGFTQTSPQAMSGDMQHVPAAHCPELHTLPQPPQFCASVEKSVQNASSVFVLLAQTSWPEESSGQSKQRPNKQIPLSQIFPQQRQLFGLSKRSTQVSLQTIIDKRQVSVDEWADVVTEGL
jgi:hypothetical protein